MLETNMGLFCDLTLIMQFSDRELFLEQFRDVAVLAKDRYKILREMAFRPVLL